MEYGGYNDPRTENNMNPEDADLSAGNSSVNNPDLDITGGQPDANPQQPQEPVFDQKGFGLNYKGQVLYPNDKQHLINLAQQGYSYSQKMEDLNRRQKELDETGNTYGHYRKLDELMQKNPELNQRITQVYNDFMTAQQSGQPYDGLDENIDPRYNQLLTKISEMEQWKNQLTEEQADVALEKSIQTLREKYPDQPWDQDNGYGTLQQRLLTHAYENNISNLELAYKDLMWDNIQANTAADALKENKLQRQRNFQAGIIEGGAPGGGQGAMDPNALQYDPNDSYSDISQKAIKQLGG